MVKLIKGALIALLIAAIVLAITGLVWYVPATPERGGHYCIGTVISCFKV
jgi:hypothetical protein